jgi:hypothetical protein
LNPYFFRARCALGGFTWKSPLLRVMKSCKNRQVTGPRRAGSAVTVHHGLTACPWVPMGAGCCPSAARPPSRSCSASSARSAARFALVRTVTAVDASLASPMILAPALYLVEGKKLRLPRPPPGSRSPGRSHLRPSRSLRGGPAGRHDRRLAAAAEPRRSRAALQLRRTMKTGRMSRLSFRR